MTVTRVVTNFVKPREQGVCGEFSIILDDSLCIHKIRVIAGQKGLFIAFPNSGSSNDEAGARRYDDIVHPTNNFLRQAIADEVLKQYRQELEDLQ